MVGLSVIIVLRIIRIKVKDRIHQLEKDRAIDAERLRISKDMHDEIGSGLTHIALLTELISTQQKTVTQIKSEVGTISSTAQKLVQSMGEIIWVTHPHNDTIENLLAYLRKSFFDPSSKRSPDERSDIRGQPRRMLELTAFEPAYRFAHAGYVAGSP